MGLLPNCGIRLDSARGLSCSSPPRGMRVRRLVVVSPTPRKRFPCCLQVEKPCKRLAVFLHQRASMLANRMAPTKTSNGCACARNCHPPMIDRFGSSLGQVASSPETAANKKLLRKWRQKRGQGQTQQRLPKFPPNVGPTAMDAFRPSATMTDA